MRLSAARAAQGREHEYPSSRLLRQVRKSASVAKSAGSDYLLQDMLDDEALDPAVELEVREQLEALTDPELSEEEQRERWERVKDLAPSLWEKSGAQKILESVAARICFVASDPTPRP
jgi:hypothetical protein